MGKSQLYKETIMADKSNNKDKPKDVIVQGVCHYNHLFEPDNTFPPPKYKITLQVDDKTKKTLESLGLNVKNSDKKPELGNYIEAKTNFYKKDGTENPIKPRIFDTNNKQLTMQDLPNGRLGRGTEVYVKLNPFPYTAPGGQTGVTAILRSVKIIKFVADTGSGAEDFPEVNAPPAAQEAATFN